MNQTGESIYDVSSTFYLTSSIVITTVGLIGNLLSLYILSKPQFRDISFFRYLIVTMANDIINLATWWPSILPYQTNTDSVSCKLVTFFGYLFYQFCPWIIVVSSIDRLLSVKYPAKFRFRTKLKYQAALLSVIFGVLVLLNVPFYSYFDIYSISDETTECSTGDSHIQINLDFAVLLISTVIPFIIMVVCSSVIGRTLITNRARLLQNRKNYQKEFQLINTMHAMNLFFLVCNLPFSIQQLVFDIMQIFNITSDLQPLVYDITNTISFCKNAFGFFLYVSCNKLFRGYFFSIINCQNTVSPMSLISSANTRH